MRAPSSQKCRLDLTPPLADRFILGFPIDYGPVLLRRPFGFYLGGHPAFRITASSGFRSVLAVSRFRFRARFGRSIPATFPGLRGCEPRFLDMAPHISEPEGLQPS